MPSFAKRVKSAAKKGFKFVHQHWAILLVVIVGSWLRTSQLQTQGILFFDAGRDLLTAQQAVESSNFPLTGIPSSIPRFHQGPITLWLEMLIYLIVGQQTLIYSLVFALIGVLAVIAVYELVVTQLDQTTGHLAAVLLALSPLAIAHSRVPYHTTPIPLMTVFFLTALIYWWQDGKYGALITTLAWAGLMQFELSLLALGLMVPYLIWRRKKKLNWPQISQLAVGFLIGFWPQIIHDLTHPIKQSQLFGFLAWAGYRLVSLTGLTGEHQLSGSQLVSAMSSFGKYFHRMFGVESLIISLVFLALTILGTRLAWMKRDKLPPVIELTIITTLFLTSSYLLHGAPSEAYFPAFLPLLSLLIGWTLKQVFNQRLTLVAGLIMIWASINFIAIKKHHFFVSNSQDFNYKASIQEQRDILSFMVQASNRNFQLRTTQEAGKFPSYFDNFRWLATETGLSFDNEKGQVFYVEGKDSALAGYPDINKVIFPSFDVYY